MSKLLDYTGLQYYHGKVEGEISQLRQEVEDINGTLVTYEDGIYLTDMNGNIICRIDSLDVPALSPHFKYLLGVEGGWTNEDGIFVIDGNNNIILKLNPFDVSSFSDHFKGLVRDCMRPTITISTSDTEVQILTKMLNAFNVGNCDVVFEKGTYTFSEVYAYMRDTLGWTWTMELPIGNGCDYYLNGSTLISNAPTGTYSDSRNILGCKAGRLGNTSFNLHDGILINNGGTYCVHDECAYTDSPYKHEYHNMRMVLNSGAGTEGLSKCIGGGAGPDGVIIIDNCVFTNNNTVSQNTEDVSWHGITDENQTCNLSFFVTDNYFSRKFRINTSFKSGDVLFVKYSCNKSAAAPNITDDPTTIETYLYNNVN